MVLNCYRVFCFSHNDRTNRKIEQNKRYWKDVFALLTTICITFNFCLLAVGAIFYAFANKQREKQAEKTGVDVDDIGAPFLSDHLAAQGGYKKVCPLEEWLYGCDMFHRYRVLGYEDARERAAYDARKAAIKKKRIPMYADMISGTKEEEYGLRTTGLQSAEDLEDPPSREMFDYYRKKSTLRHDADGSINPFMRDAWARSKSYTYWGPTTDDMGLIDTEAWYEILIVRGYADGLPPDQI